MGNGDTMAGAPQRPTEPLMAERSLGDLFGDLSAELGELFRQEVELAKTEARSELKQAGAGVGMLAVAAVSALLSLVMLSMALAWVLDKGLDRSLSFALVGVLWGLIGGALAVTARRRTQGLQALPQTTQSLKEDAQWIKTKTS